MGEQTPAELQRVLRPIASLISKSEKAQQKLAPGTWQHTMLRDNLKALRIASMLMGGVAGDACTISNDDLRETLGTLTAMIEQVEKTKATFATGTSQHTLQRNRL